MQREPITINEDLCQLCGKCAEICPFQIFETNEEKINVVKPEGCIQCGHCVSVCPEHAISVGEDRPIPFSDNKTVAPEQMLHHIRSRRSTRIYKDKPIPREIIEQVVEAGRYAPTGGNFQSIYLTIVADRLKQEILREKLLAYLESQAEMSESWLKRLKKKGELLSDSEKHTIAVWSGFRRQMDKLREGRDVIFWGAPLVIVLHGATAIGSNQWNADVIAMCMALMAESLGLGSCFLGWPPLADEAQGEALREVIDLPKGPGFNFGLSRG